MIRSVALLAALVIGAPALATESGPEAGSKSDAGRTYLALEQPASGTIADWGEGIGYRFDDRRCELYAEGGEVRSAKRERPLGRIVAARGAGELDQISNDEILYVPSSLGPDGAGIFVVHEALAGRVGETCILALDYSVYHDVRAYFTAGGDMDDLAGTSWRAVTIMGEPVADGVASTLAFEDEERVEGSGGCNRYFGAVEIAGDRIIFGPMGSTKMFCAGPAGEQEDRFFQALGTAERFAVEAGELLIYSKDASAPSRFVADQE